MLAAPLLRTRLVCVHDTVRIELLPPLTCEQFLALPHLLVIQLLHGGLHPFTSAPMDAISSPESVGAQSDFLAASGTTASRFLYLNHVEPGCCCGTSDAGGRRLLAIGGNDHSENFPRKNREAIEHERAVTERD